MRKQLALLVGLGLLAWASVTGGSLAAAGSAPEQDAVFSAQAPSGAGVDGDAAGDVEQDVDQDVDNDEAEDEHEDEDEDDDDDDHEENGSEDEAEDD